MGNRQRTRQDGGRNGGVNNWDIKGQYRRYQRQYRRCFVTLVIGNMIDEKLDIEKYYKYAKEDLNRRDIEDDKRAKIFGLAQDMMEVIRDEYYYDTLFHTLVDLVEIAEIHNLKFTDCVESAYDEIKDRKGKTIDGCFVKAEDL